MFEAIKQIDVDRKNSLPVADFSNRYQATSTPVILGDITQRWPAYRKWNLAFFKRKLGPHNVDVYSNHVATNGGNSQKPVMTLSGEEYFQLLMTQEDDLQIRNLEILKLLPELSNDFTFPRLGIRFRRRASRLHIGGTGARENMHYRSDLAASFLCNFGGKQNVLLVRPEQAKYTYEPPASFESLPTVDYSEKGLKKNPAIANINAYYAELQHGDVLFIPSGYRYAIEYKTISFGFTLTVAPQSAMKVLHAMHNNYVLRPLDNAGQAIFGSSWQKRKVRKAVRRSKR